MSRIWPGDKPSLLVRWTKRMSLPSLTAGLTNAGSTALRAEASGRKHTATAQLRIRRFERDRANGLPLQFILAGPFPVPSPQVRQSPSDGNRGPDRAAGGRTERSARPAPAAGAPAS